MYLYLHGLNISLPPLFSCIVGSHAPLWSKNELCFFPASTSIDTVLLWQHRCKCVGRRITDASMVANVLCFDQEWGLTCGSDSYVRSSKCKTYSFSHIIGMCASCVEGELYCCNTFWVCLSEFMLANMNILSFGKWITRGKSIVHKIILWAWCFYSQRKVQALYKTHVMLNNFWLVEQLEYVIFIFLYVLYYLSTWKNSNKKKLITESSFSCSNRHL